nr:transposase [uncultured Desulfobacter sp.]
MTTSFGQTCRKRAAPISYMLNHWQELTRFLEIPGAPLDNNLCEQLLKKSILHRKNSLFYKTEHGAYIGDLFMSLIHTCNLQNINPFEYLTALQKHSSEIFQNPSDWLPWSFENTIAKKSGETTDNL